MKPMSKKTNEEIYLEWLNDWLTVEAMAENYNIEVNKLIQMINEGRDDFLIHNESQAYLKAWKLI